MKYRFNHFLALLSLLLISGTTPQKADADPLALQAPLAAQAAEQGYSNEILKSANSLQSPKFGSFSYTHVSCHQWGKQDPVENFFSNISQLLGKYFTELINDCLAKSAQRVFPIVGNVAGGNLLDAICAGDSSFSKYFLLVYLIQAMVMINLVRQRLVDSSDNKLVHTICILICFPLFARTLWHCNMWICWQIQARFDWPTHGYAVAQIIKGGLIAAGDGATCIFAPLLANLAIPAVGQFVGQLFYFCSAIILSFLNIILISDMLKLISLMVFRSTLAFALCLAAPYSLSSHAITGKGKLCVDFLRVFGEVNLWQLAWLGILNLISLLLTASLHPWLKIILMITLFKFIQKLPLILQKTGMSPVSQWLDYARTTARQFFVLRHPRG